MTALDAVRAEMRTLRYRAWSLTHPTDVRKIGLELTGQRRPMPQDSYAFLIVEGIRLGLGASPAPPVTLGAYGNGLALYRNPRGGVENVQAAVTGGLRTALLNYGDHSPAEWGDLITRLEAAGVTWGWWAHCRDTSRLVALLDRSVRDSRKVVGVNVEAELETTLGPAVLAQAVAQIGYKGDPCLIAYGWVQNNVSLSPIADWVVALEMFPQDDPNLWPPDEKVHDCLTHARQAGGRRLMQLKGSYPMSVQAADKILTVTGRTVTPGPSDPAWWDNRVPTGLFTVDDSAEDWARWGWKP